MSPSQNFPKLFEAAVKARNHAYCPHSGYQVGSAVLGTNGKLYGGCNVENDAFGLCNCAERTAIFSMVADGCQELAEVVVVTADLGTPCGQCRQVLAQFGGPDLIVTCATVSGETVQYRLDELLPHAFRLKT